MLPTPAWVLLESGSGDNTSSSSQILWDDLNQMLWDDGTEIDWDS